MFLQSDILRAAEGLRDAIEEVDSASFALHPLHSEPGATFAARSPGGFATSSGGYAPEGGEEPPAAAAGEDDGGWQPALADASSSGDDGSGDEGEPFISAWAAAGWLRDNPVGVPTEREFYVASTQGADVYRVLLVKT